MSHTKGKWIASDGWSTDMVITTQARIDASLASICTIDVDFDGEFGEEQVENMSRILACVNACEGISTENLEENKPLIYVVRRMNALLKQCGEPLEVMPERQLTDAKDAARYRVFVAALVAGINHDPLTPVQQAMLDAFALEEGTATVDEVTAVIDAAMATAKVTP